MIGLFYFDKELKKEKIENLEQIKNKPIWIDITAITKEEAELIRKNFNLHPLTTEDLVNQNVRIKVEEFPDYLFCVFYGIEKTKQIELMELDFILGENFIITNHKKEIGAYKELMGNKGKLENLFNKGIDFLFHKLLDIEIDNYFPVLETIDDQIEEVENEVIKRARAESLAKILKLKRILSLIKKATLPQREKISFLTKNDYRLISSKALPYFRDVYDHSIRVSDSVDNYKESIANTFDVYMSTLSNNMNEVMKTLSIIATIALPLTVISGIYGTNFSILPGQNFIYGFWAMIFAMILVSVAMLHFFKRRKWF